MWLGSQVRASQSKSEWVKVSQSKSEQVRPCMDLEHYLYCIRVPGADDVIETVLMATLYTWSLLSTAHLVPMMSSRPC
jgi:hypothetical protein